MIRVLADTCVLLDVGLRRFGWPQTKTQAAVLSAKLKRLDKWSATRGHNASLYSKAFAELDIITPFEPEYAESVYNLYMIRTKNRDELRERLGRGGVSIGLHCPVPLHLQDAFAHLGYKRGDFPVAEKLAQEILSLPMFPELEAAAIKRCTDVIKDFLNNRGAE